jgi:hypothetical protein
MIKYKSNVNSLMKDITLKDKLNATHTLVVPIGPIHQLNRIHNQKIRHKIVSVKIATEG